MCTGILECEKLTDFNKMNPEIEKRWEWSRNRTKYCGKFTNLMVTRLTTDLEIFQRPVGGAD